ncbi:MAG: methyltransferase type 12, partial [Deltaproteobacteria bacterium]|nr:methyltransferase type 12 [Deltaproteobacteria bacterium]
MDAIVRDLNQWIPRLLAVWRRARRQEEGPSDRLLPQEMREVSAGVRTLSKGLTRDRELAGARYMEDPKLLG